MLDIGRYDPVDAATSPGWAESAGPFSTHRRLVSGPIAPVVWLNLAVADGYPRVLTDRDVLVVRDGAELRAPMRAFLDGYDGPHPRYRIELVLRGDLFTATGPDMFEALLRLRRQLEPYGYAVAVQGARRDVWPSGMARDMGGGMKAHVMRPGQDATLSGLVQTLDDAPVDLLGTIAEQEKHRDSWHGRPAAHQGSPADNTC